MVHICSHEIVERIVNYPILKAGFASQNEYGIFLYATDLSTYTYAPRTVKYELQKLIEEYGLENVAEEIAIYLKYNYPNEFGIDIVCIP